MMANHLPHLPQREPNPAQRRRLLKRRQKEYQYTPFFPGVPVHRSKSIKGFAGPDWYIKVLNIVARVRLNWQVLTDSKGLVFELDPPDLSPDMLVDNALRFDLQGFWKMFSYNPGVCLTPYRPQSFTGYWDLFRAIERPKLTEQELFSDQVMADSFVQGVNPLNIKIMTHEYRDKFPISDLHMRHSQGFEEDSVDQAIAERRLFIVDHDALEDLEPGYHPQVTKYVYAPMIALAVPRGGGKLRCIGIQCGQDPSIYPIRGPWEGFWDWQLAKMIVRIADMNHHEVITHLSRGHLIVDAIGVATERSLASNHPVFKLLKPHFKGTTQINTMAVEMLLAPNGEVEELLAPSLGGMVQMITEDRKAYRFTKKWLPNDLVERGLTDCSDHFKYPYAEDATLVAEAIRKWVGRYLSIYYQSDADVLKDEEIQQWARELGHSEEGNVQDFLGQDFTSQDLTETLTAVIFTCSAYHAALNFPQKDASLIPLYPLCGYGPADFGSGLTEKDVLEYLPPVDRAIKQAHVLSVLGSVYHTRLGDYGFSYFTDKRVHPHLTAFQADLESIETTIGERNLTRHNPYDMLKPSLIPQSINI